MKAQSSAQYIAFTNAAVVFGITYFFTNVALYLANTLFSPGEVDFKSIPQVARAALAINWAVALLAGRIEYAIVMRQRAAVPSPSTDERIVL